MSWTMIISSLTVIGAVCARLVHTNRPYWFSGWGVLALVYFLTLLSLYNPAQALFMVFFASLVGFLGPEIWHALQNVVRASRAVGMGVIVIIGILFIFLFPDIAGQIITLVIICGVLWYIFSPIFRHPHH